MYYIKRKDMQNTELGKLTAARCTLAIMASGMKIKGVRVRDVAQEIGAPRMSWKARGLIKWVDEKIDIVT